MTRKDLTDNPLKKLVWCAICRENEVAIFYAEEDYYLNCWQEMTHPKI